MSQKPSRNSGGLRPSRSSSPEREGADSGRRNGAADSRKEDGSRKADGPRKEGGNQGRPQKPQSARSALRSQTEARSQTAPRSRATPRSQAERNSEVERGSRARRGFQTEGGSRTGQGGQQTARSPQKGQGRNPARAQGGSGEKIFAKGRSRQPEGGGARSQNNPPRAQAEQPSSKELYPSAEFARREGILEGLPTQMLVNRALKGYAFRKQFPWCLRLVVAYRADPQNGLPVAKEEGALEAFEQNLFGLLKRSVNGHYVGHTSWRGTREFVFYLDEGSEAEEPLNAFAEKQKRELEFALDSDPRWEQVAHYFDYTD